MTTQTLDEPLDEWECCCKYDTCTNACAPLVAHLKQRLDAIDKVKVPEPTIWAMDWNERKMRVVNKDEHLDEYVWHEDYKIVIDLLRAETVRANQRIAYEGKTIHEHFEARLKAEAENAALREKLHDVCEIYAGMDGFVPQTAPEDYQRRILKKMYDAAIAGKDKP